MVTVGGSKYSLENLTVLPPESEEGAMKQCEQEPNAAFYAISKL